MQKSIIFSCWKSHRKSDCLVQNIWSFKNADFRFFLLNFAVAVHQQHSLHCNAHHAAFARSPPPFPMSSTDILAASGWRIVTEGHHLAKTEPSDDSSAAPPRPPRRSAGARPVRPGRPAKPAKLTEAGVTNSFLHQKCLFLCVEDELRAWNVDVHCSSLVKGLDWTARGTLC